MSHNRPTGDLSVNTRWLVAMMKLLSVLALIVDRQRLVVVAARSKGLIYNRDGKFIYRPARPNQGHIIVIDDRHRDGSSQQDRSPLSGAGIGWPPIESHQPMSSMYRAYSVMNVPAGFFGGRGIGQTEMGAYPAAIPAASQHPVQLIAVAAADPRFAPAPRLPVIKPPAYQTVALIRPQLASRLQAGGLQDVSAASLLQILRPAANYAPSPRTSYASPMLPQQQYPHIQYQSLADLELLGHQASSRIFDPTQVELSRTLPVTSRHVTIPEPSSESDLLSPMEEVAPWNEVFEDHSVGQRRLHQLSNSQLPVTTKSAFDAATAEVQASPEALGMDELWPREQPMGATHPTSELASQTHVEHTEHDSSGQLQVDKPSSSSLHRKLAAKHHHPPEQHSMEHSGPFRSRKSFHKNRSMGQESMHHHMRPHGNTMNFNSIGNGGSDKNANYWKKFRHQFEIV